MRRPLLLVSLVPISLSAIGLWAWQPTWLGHSMRWWKTGLSAEASLGMADDLTVDALAEVDVLRQVRNVPPLQEDRTAAKWLRKTLTAEPLMAMEDVLDKMKEVFPQYLESYAFNSRHTTVDGLLDRVRSWTRLEKGSLSHIAISVQPLGRALGWQLCVVTGTKAPDFAPEKLRVGGPSTFYNWCSLCNKGQLCEIPTQSRSLSLECPHCHQIYAILASDIHGQFHYVNEFLTGYAPPAYFGKKQGRLYELIAIWQTVARECRYILDDENASNDAWQTALETQSFGHGDCEDSSILLADWLIARGFEARVALGRFAERGGHAWVVVRLEGEDYLLESTEGASYATRPPLLAETGARYVPEVLFDRDAYYSRPSPKRLWNNDYWSDKTWVRVTPGPRPSAADESVPVKGEAKSVAVKP